MIRMNHMELTVPPGMIAADGEALFAFLHAVFGFERAVFPEGSGFPGVPSLVVRTDPDASQFLFIAEHEQPLARASEDHLGFQFESAEHVSEALDRCRQWRATDPRVEIREFDMLDLERTTTHAFYVRYLLPIWFDIQHIANKPGCEAAHEWRWLPNGGARSRDEAA